MDKTEIIERPLKPHIDLDQRTLELERRFADNVIPILCDRFGISYDDFIKIQDSLRKQPLVTGQNRKAAKEWIKNQKSFLQSLSSKGAHLDADVNFANQTLVVDISFDQKEEPEIIRTPSGVPVGRMISSRYSRPEIFTIRPEGFSYCSPDTEIDFTDDSANIDDMPGYLLVSTTDNNSGIIGGILTISAEKPESYRDRVCFTVLEGSKPGDKPHLPAEVYGSWGLGVQAYYSEDSDLRSLASYFVDERYAQCFGLWQQSTGETNFHPVGQKEDILSTARVPVVSVSDESIGIKRNNSDLSFPRQIDMTRMLDSMVHRLSEKLMK